MGTHGSPAGNVTAGFIGFVVLFALAMACWLLFSDMSKRLRNVRRREELEGRIVSQGQLVTENARQTRKPATSEEAGDVDAGTEVGEADTSEADEARETGPDAV